ncbi:MAG: hypothetical protein AABX17_03165 [Nanoarchaeota archaeon]
MTKEAPKYGRAYSFFDCSAPKSKIERELDYVRTHSNLELSLVEGEENMKDPETLKALEAAKKFIFNRLPEYQKEGTTVSYKYALKAKLPNATNVATANKLNNIMNYLYGRKLYADGERSCGEIVYQRGNKWAHAHYN